MKQAGVGLIQRVLVLGGSSEIAVAIVRELAARGQAREVVLAGRDGQRLQAASDQLRDTGCARVQTLALQAHRSGTDPGGDHGGVLAQALAMLGGIDLVIVAVGVLGERGGLPTHIDEAVEVLEVNVVGAGSMLLHSARALREQGDGTIVVLSSVAAERPRASNAVYCASKAGLDALARALADDLAPHGVRVMVVRPGFVTTRMTRGLAPAPFATDARAVARATVAGLRRGAPVVWAPPGLRWVMGILRLLPSPVFRRLA
jgi:decaprenylphospho-beta-D-erythro-pentofuranosid-2-ulose 2-reductase